MSKVFVFVYVDDDGFRSLQATEKIRMGEVIVELPKISQPEADMYSIEIIPGVHVNCSKSLVGAINHGCDPNAAVRRGSIVAWRCIEPGENITIDYKKTEQKLAEPFDCLCGSKFCRGRIE